MAGALSSGDHMRMAQVCRATGFSARQLRYYDQHGLVVPARSPGGHRLYSQAQVERLRTLAALLRTGLSLPQAAAALAITWH